ncbi:DUF6048 family protein [Sungkyunkwania multivorans]|uniref:DUF6048 family protein n=1 Tax=Sungkyunkwania multivorans TaxID=1173618 RepID=A0ABW3CV62_9FLAO
MSGYFISLLCCLLVVTSSFAQETERDSIAYKEKYGIRLGADIVRPTRTFLDDDYSSFEIVGDYRISRKFYIAAELGSEERTKNDDRLNYTTTGSYIKVGFDYNFYENWMGMENAIYGGLRFGISTHKQTLNSYQIYTIDQAWGEGGLLGADPDILGEYDGLSGQWIEVVFGIKVETFNNLYIGASARLHSLLSDTAPSTFDNLYIPGFNKVTSDNSFGASFNYTISYLIPIYKKKK